MKLKSGSLYWPSINEPFREPAPLNRDIRRDVVIIGSGLTGMLVANALIGEGVSVAILDKRGTAKGSTSASTALVQYEIDVPLFELIAMRGRQDAVRCYYLCHRAISAIAN